MRYKRVNKLNNHYKYYKKKELKQIQLFSLSVLCTYLNFDINFLRKIYTNQNFVNKSNLRTYCIFSGRSKGLCSKIYVSRIKIRDLNFSRIFLGLRKIS